MLIPVPYRDPAAVYAGFAGEQGAVFLDSADGSGWSCVAVRPRRWIVQNSGAREDPFQTIETLLAAREPLAARELAENPLPFTGGVIGFLGYEMNGRLERLPPPSPAGFAFPDFAAGLYESVMIFVPAARRAWIAAPDDETAQCLATAGATAPDLPPVDWHRAGTWRADLSRAVYEAKVRHVIAAITAGEVFQVNLSQRFVAALPRGLTPFMLYRRLRSLTPAPFAACLSLGEGRYILSASPERFLKADPLGRVETCPIKGTRPRGTTAAADAALAAALVASAKDRAENLMIVDLLRNDLAKVCRPGSVRVPALCRLESFANVHHLVSVIEGRLATGQTAVDLLRGAFPGGSVTGAPKIRAMEIITALEPCRRGPYCGTIFWLGHDGTMDSSIVIRTLMVEGARISAHAGGGIVHDSDPAREWEETMVKAAPLRAALTGGMGAPP
ncbi:MAG: para-aminobenzoate synthetase component I [Rhodospirillaceae bacterium]|nr:MAG: para-aminobenzoate synthetase component I [Rhodospirillaceae bacterium]